MAILCSMAISRIKGTYTLDVETVRTIEALARRWGTSKSEVLRRAVRAAATTKTLSPPVSALAELQRRVRLSEPAAARWIKAARDERRSR
jgi:hypothetical protein